MNASLKEQIVALGSVVRGPQTRKLLTIAAVDAIGTGLYLATSSLYLTRQLHFSAGAVGIGQSLFAVGGMIAMVPLGHLADRIGVRRVITGLYAWQAICFIALATVNAPWHFWVISLAIGSAEWSTKPLMRALVSSLAESTRVQALSAMAVVRNTGFALGALAAALINIAPSRASFVAILVANAVTFGIAAIMISTFRGDGLPATRPQSGHLPKRRGLPNGRLVVMTILNAFLYVHPVLLTVGIPVWIATATDAPPWVVSAVITVNTAIVIVLQLPLSGTDPSARAGARRQLAAGFTLMLACVCMALSSVTHGTGTVVIVIVGVVCVSLAEIWQVAGAWRISYALASEKRQAADLAFFESGTTWVSALAPVLLTVAVVEQGAVGWGALAAVCLSAGVAVAAIESRGTLAARV